MADKSKRGFASIDPEKAREIRRLDGLAIQRLGKAHRLTHEEVRKGGKTSQANLRRQRAKAKNHNSKSSEAGQPQSNRDATSGEEGQESVWRHKKGQQRGKL